MSGFLDQSEIKAILPHREPFLFVDKITAIEAGKSIVGELSVDETKRFLAHHRDPATLPPTILVEAMAQVGAILVLQPDENRGRTIYFRAIEDCEFERTVPLGATLRIVAEVRKMRARFGILSVTGYLGSEVAAKAVMSFALG